MKQFALKPEEIKDVLTDVPGPQGCIASDRITVDGLRVGYMYREAPHSPDVPDSGWRFFAGDEDETYTSDPDKAGVYALNTICNYSPDIIPILRSNPPYGIAFFRNPKGVFEAEHLQPPEE